MYNTQPMIENWKRQRDRIDEMIQNYQAMPTNPNPINNFISTNVPSQDNLQFNVMCVLEVQLPLHKPL